MSLINAILFTRGTDRLAQFRILQRHLLALKNHTTPRKLANLFRTEYNRILKRDTLTSFPYILKIESTNICNVRCAYCYKNRSAPEEGERKYGKMSLESFKKIIDEIGKYLFKINLYGFGEPLLFPESLDMTEYAASKNIGVAISSNMNFKDISLAKRMVDSGLEVLIASCHGTTPQSYNRFMKGGDIRLFLKNVELLVAERTRQGVSTPLIDWQFCVTKFNQSEMEQAKIIAKRIGVHQIRFIKPNLPPEAGEEWHSDYFPQDDLNQLRRQNFSCSWPYRAAYINHDGGVLPCCKETRNLANDFGNVFEESFASIWNNEKYRSSRQVINKSANTHVECDTMCARCILLPHNHS